MSNSNNLALKVAVLGSFTVDLLAREIERTLRKMNVQPALYVGGYNQYRQDLLNAQSEYYLFAPDVTLLTLDALDLFPNFFSSRSR